MAGGLAAARRLWRGFRRRPWVWRRRLRRLPRPGWTWPDLALILAYIGAAVAAANLLAGRCLPPVWVLAARVLLLHGGGILLVLLLRRRRHPRRLPRRLPARHPWRWGVVFYLAALPFVMAAGFLNHALLRLAGRPTALQDAALELLTTENLAVRLVLIAAAGVTAPVFEELLFRGMALPLAARSGGAIPAILATAAAFALIHLHPAALLPLFVLAVFLSLAYIYTRSLGAAIIMHALFNLVNIALLLLLF